MAITADLVFEWGTIRQAGRLDLVLGDVDDSGAQYRMKFTDLPLPVITVLCR